MGQELSDPFQSSKSWPVLKPTEMASQAEPGAIAEALDQVPEWSQHENQPTTVKLLLGHPQKATPQRVEKLSWAIPQGWIDGFAK